MEVFSIVNIILFINIFICDFFIYFKILGEIFKEDRFLYICFFEL